jgi:chemotaxis protein methyltransferase CheR
MKEQDCVEFLQWALPRLHMRWAGFRRVRKQVCKRITRRMRQLELDGIGAYRAYLYTHPEEWAVLDGLTCITISRFYRDRQVFQRLEHSILPAIADAALRQRRSAITVCSLGCSSGEEPYSLSLLWSLKLQARFPTVHLRIVAVDADPCVLERARKGCYTPGSMKELPDDLRESGFMETDQGLCLRPEFMQPVELIRHDIRTGIPDGPYDIILCRNVAFTYFDEPLQATFARVIYDALRPGGLLLTGGHERLPEGHPFEARPDERCFYWKPGKGVGDINQ